MTGWKDFRRVCRHGMQEGLDGYYCPLCQQLARDAGLPFDHGEIYVFWPDKARTGRSSSRRPTVMEDFLQAMEQALRYQWGERPGVRKTILHPNGDREVTTYDDFGYPHTVVEVARFAQERVR